MESPCRSRFSGRNCGPVEQSLPKGLCPVEEARARIVCEEQQLWEGPALEQCIEGCRLWEGPYAGAGQKHEEEGAAERNCYELGTAPVPHPPCAIWDKGGGRRIGNEVEAWEEGVVRWF